MKDNCERTKESNPFSHMNNDQIAKDTNTPQDSKDICHMIPKKQIK